MKEVLGSAPVDVEKKPPVFLRNTLVAHAVALAAEHFLKDGLTLEGRKLLKTLVVRACHGERVSISKELPLVYKGSDQSIEVEGQQHIPSAGSAMLIGNHVRGGPLQSIGPYIEMVKQGYDARCNVQEEEIREPFIIVQRGLGGWLGKRYATSVFYDMAVNSLNCEAVSIAVFDKSKDDKDGKEIVNRQGLSHTAVERIVNGGASLWLPQGRHRAHDDFNFPEKATGFLAKIDRISSDVQLVPVKSISDAKGNMKVIFGESVGIRHVVSNGGINYFAQVHLASLG